MKSNNEKTGLPLERKERKEGKKGKDRRKEGKIASISHYINQKKKYSIVVRQLNVLEENMAEFMYYLRSK